MIYCPRGSKYPIFEVSGSKNHTSSRSGDQKPQVSGPSRRFLEVHWDACLRRADASHSCIAHHVLLHQRHEVYGPAQINLHMNQGPVAGADQNSDHITDDLCWNGECKLASGEKHFAKWTRRAEQGPSIW